MIGIRECQHAPFGCDSEWVFFIDLKLDVRASLCVSHPSLLVSTFQLTAIAVIDRQLMGRNGWDRLSPLSTPSTSIDNVFICVFFNIYKVISSYLPF